MRRFLPLVFFFAHGALAGEERAGQLWLSAATGGGFGPSGSMVRDLEKRQNDPFTGGRFGYTTFLRGNSEQVLWNAAANASAPALSYQSSQSRLVFEYGLGELAGIGFSIVDQRLNVRNMRSNISSDPAVLLLLSSIYASSSSPAYNQALIQLELADPLVRSNALPYTHATSVNALGRIHPLSGAFDPYAGLSLGLAREWQLPTYAWRLEPAVGLRVHMGRFFVEAELTYTMILPGRKGAWPIPPKKRWNESFVQMGAGFRVD